ncbi:MAG TPA: septum formation initiator family protein [Nitrospiria bacterium]|jgi:cell division protein FtsB
MAQNRKRSDVRRRKKNQRRLILAIGLFFGLSVLLSFFFGERGLMGFLRMQNKKSQLTEEIQNFKEQNADLLKEAEALRNDPEHIEGLARERLGMIQKGELIYQFEKTP